VRRRVVGLAIGFAAPIALSGTAHAWDSPEHTAFGEAALAAACGVVGGDIVCGSQLETYKALAGKALAEPDHCHSFWYSDTGISLNGDDSAHRSNCAINFGTPLTQTGGVSGALASISSGYRSLDHTIYVLVTNSNHFGANTHAHFTLYHQIAKQAAQLRNQLATYYATPPNSEVTQVNPLIDVCTQDAIAIEGFALHYMTDRAAAGHAWNAQPHYTSLLPLSAAGVRGCIHGQGLSTRLELTSTAFSCVDSPLLGSPNGKGMPVHQGLGDTGRAFGDAFWNQGLWMSDDNYFVSGDTTNPKAPSQQQAQVAGANSPAQQAFQEILNTLSGGSGTDPTWTDAFVSNQDFCRVTLSECCHSPSNGSLGSCGSCTPDISDAQLQSLCPVDVVQTAAVSGTSWVALAGGFTGSSLYYAHVNPSGGASGTNVAQTLAHTLDPSTTNPDALWDQSNDILTRLGCEEFDVTSAMVPSAPLDGSPVKATVAYKGNPKFPLTVHWRANTTASQGTLCTAPSGVPGLCGPEDYTISAAPSGSTASSPAPLTITNWVCPGTGTSATPVSAPGYLYITDANNAWTPAYKATLTCGAGDAGLIALDGGLDGGGNGGDGATTDATFDGSSDGDTGITMGMCTHDVCTTGTALNTSCSSCTDQVCSLPANIYCCDAVNGIWGPSCVLAATSLGCASCP
jgi:hypothetical protein